MLPPQSQHLSQLTVGLACSSAWLWFLPSATSSRGLGEVAGERCSRGGAGRGSRGDVAGVGEVAGGGGGWERYQPEPEPAEYTNNYQHNLAS